MPKKRKSWPANPKTLAEFNSTKVPVTLKNKENFLLFDITQVEKSISLRLTAFSSVRLITILADCGLIGRSGDIWIDGTFKCVPRI